MPVFTIYKKIGETPLEALDRIRIERPELKDETLSYIGRLDPMAEGAMLVLSGEENKRREKYLSLDKEYVAEVLFGFSTDTYDLLGMVTEQGIPHVLKESVVEALKRFLGTRMQEYPAYSSKTVGGVPLHALAREGKIASIERPKNKVTVYSIELVDWGNILKNDLARVIDERIALVKGDFRQAEILSRWSDELARAPDESFPVGRIFLSCSSGTYVRSIAQELGAMLGVPALALSIKRTLVKAK